MSMFYELMMRKKEEIMYATIKGSLTENDGVFSGFSATSYLTLQQTISINQDTNFELVTKINTTAIDQSSSFMGTMDSVGLAFRISGAGKLAFYLGDGSSWIVNALTGITIFSTNTDYYVKVSINNGVITTSSSIDGKNWTQEATTTVTFSQTYNYVISLGIGRINTSFFKGSIDLNNSYIKLGSTKYKLQAVVGYTVVGSPTITDGVVSGFSANDYLQLPNFPTLDNNSKVEIYVESKIYDNSTTYAILSAYNSDTYDIKIMIDTSKRLYGYVYNNVNSTRYYVRLWCSELTPTSLLHIKYTIQNNLLELARKIDLLDWRKGEVSLTESFSYTKATPLCIGRSLNGEIHIKNTYIKINNKLWFNGQEG